MHLNFIHKRKLLLADNGSPPPMYSIMPTVPVQMKHFHHQLDADGNGVVDRKDYDLIAQGFIDRGKLTGDK